MSSSSTSLARVQAPSSWRPGAGKGRTRDRAGSRGEGGGCVAPQGHGGATGDARVPHGRVTGPSRMSDLVTKMPGTSRFLPSSSCLAGHARRRVRSQRQHVSLTANSVPAGDPQGAGGVTFPASSSRTGARCGPSRAGTSRRSDLPPVPLTESPGRRDEPLTPSPQASHPLGRPPAPGATPVPAQPPIPSVELHIQTRRRAVIDLGSTRAGWPGSSRSGRGGRNRCPGVGRLPPLGARLRGSLGAGVGSR